MGYIRLEKDADGIIDLIMDQPGEKVNLMGDEFIEAMSKAVDDIEAMKDDIKGVYVKSGKETFFGGGDLTKLLEMPVDMDEAEATRVFNGIMDAKAPLRKLETLGIPVAVGINGECLGGGYEISLACHYRVALENAAMGLPEAQLGLMPGADGVVRMVRKHGLTNAVTFVSQGKSFKGQKAIDNAYADELATDVADLEKKAKAWILANPESAQPWDKPGYTIPGGAASDKDMDQGLQGLLYFGPVNVMVNTWGNFPAAKAIFACISDVSRVDFATAQKIEARYFLSLMRSPVAKNMISTFFFQLQALEKGASRPSFDAVPKTETKKLGILGAGQMGAGIAYAAAKVGIEVALKDISLENAEKGKAYGAGVCDKLIGKGRMDEADKERILSLINPTESYDDLSDCDIVIEAVFEDRKIKAAVTKDTEAVCQGVFATNTSSLPITGLAEPSSRPENFIGMHFFSPAEKMPLVEIIKGEKTSDEALAKAFDLAIALGKKPIVVNDGEGFFTTRVIAKTVEEGAAMVLEGINPVIIENAAKQNGSPVGPLTAIDEISQATAYKNGQQLKADKEARGETVDDSNPAATLVAKMVEDFGREGKAHGAGYYEYPEGGKKYIWPGLKEHFAPNGYKEIPFEDVQDRLTFSQALEAVRAMEDGVVFNPADGNIGSIMGIGYPAQTGGVFQHINSYGVKAFAERAQYLADTYGDVFAVPQLLKDKAANGETF
ncbi:MAG: enoyl-CoA hydratase/isomerase family protein [Pseudomonadales bacterium]|nr:enoyl-CoA hydratase/isomerase family protein [Pseudomonadales bacterium]